MLPKPSEVADEKIDPRQELDLVTPFLGTRIGLGAIAHDGEESGRPVSDKPEAVPEPTASPHAADLRLPHATSDIYVRKLGLPIPAVVALFPPHQHVGASERACRPSGRQNNASRTQEAATKQRLQWAPKDSAGYGAARMESLLGLVPRVDP